MLGGKDNFNNEGKKIKSFRGSVYFMYKSDSYYTAFSEFNRE